MFEGTPPYIAWWTSSTNGLLALMLPEALTFAHCRRSFWWNHSTRCLCAIVVYILCSYNNIMLWVLSWSKWLWNVLLYPYTLSEWARE